MACHIAAIEADLALELEKVDLATGTTQAGTPFGEVSPKGYVPVLETTTGGTLPGTLAILQYLAARAQPGRLAPAAQTSDWFRMVEWLAFIATEIHKPFGALYRPDTSPEVRERTVAQLYRRFALLESQLGTSPFLNGDSFTVADAYAFTIVGWSTLMQVSLADFPRLGAYLGRIAARPAVRAAMAREGLVPH